MELATGIDTLAICDHRSSSSPSTSSLPSSSSSECEAAGGTASGTCASSFGVCCVFRSPLFVKQNPLYSIISNLYYIIPPLSIACGATMNQNNSYAIISSYSTRFTITGSLYLRSLTRRRQRQNHLYPIIKEGFNSNIKRSFEYVISSCYS